MWLASSCKPFSERTKTETQTGQERGGKSRNRDHERVLLINLLFMAPSMYFLIAHRATCLSHNNHSSSKHFNRLTYMPAWWRDFLDWVTLFLGDSSWCQIDNKIETTKQHVLSIVLSSRANLINVYHEFMDRESRQTNRISIQLLQ